MQPRALKILEFEKIKNQLKKYAASSLGIQRVEILVPATELSEVRTAQEATDEGVTVLRLSGNIPFGGIHDIRQSLKRSKMGGMLFAHELLEVAETIRGSRLVKKFIERLLEEEEVKLPILYEIISRIEPETTVEHNILACIDEHAEVKDSASETLRRIRSQIRTLDQRLKEKLDNIIRSHQYQKMLSEGIVTIRNGRYVVPVKQEYRGSFQGIVHDQSASGATLFIEPQVIVNINNDLTEVKSREKYEIERILRGLTEEVAVAADLLLNHVEELSELDFIFTKAKYSKSIKAVKPKLNDQGNIHLKGARHPLIAPDQVVPSDIVLGDDYQAMIITGPNTGGKTVTLKTLGLLTLMAQAGLQVPAEEGAEISVYSAIYADIGDEQSIEQNLSTFSSHMTNIIKILAHLDHRSLVLFDELGAGTDPQEGAALAIAILDDVILRGATVVATTHYSELKSFAYEREGVINASVEFNVETLKPTYRLLIGVPGRSNAFEISKRLGLSDTIIQHAREQISQETNQLDAMIASLEKSQKEAELAQKEAQKLRDDAANLHTELTKKLEDFEREKARALKQAEETAKDSIEKAQREAEDIIKELRTLQKESINIKEHQLIDARKRMEDVLTPLTEKTQSSRSAVQKEKESFVPGQEVKVLSIGQKGHIIEALQNGEYLVQIGIMKVNIKASDLKAVKESEKTTPVVNVRADTGHVKTELDLRGERFEEAMRKVENYIDAALLSNYHQVSIIHGKGTGALRKGVQDLLKNHSRVKRVRYGDAGEGGNGVTIVEFK